MSEMYMKVVFKNDAELIQNCLIKSHKGVESRLNGWVFTVDAGLFAAIFKGYCF